MSVSSHRPRRGDQLEVEIEDLDSKGRGVAALGRYQLAARRALPGSRVRVDVVRAKGRVVEGRVREVLRPSPDLVAASCPHVQHCGGCAFQELAYPRQLEALQARVVAALGAAGFDTPIDPVVGMQSPWAYRNKMEYAFGSRRFRMLDEPEGSDDSFALGLHTPGWYEKILDLEHCAIHFEGADGLVASARELALARGFAPWNAKEHTGFARYLVLRKGVRTGDVLVNLVTSGNATEAVDGFAQELLARHPQVTTFVHSINSRPADTAIAERERVVFGPGVIHEQVGGLRYAISAGSFFQTNTVQAELLFAAVREEAALTGEELVFDLYCGAGTIGLALAKGADAAREVHGYEVVPSAVADARRNAELNGIGNASFVEGDVRKSLEAREEGAPLPDVAIVDPPRAGLEARMVPALARLAARRIVYVSCNIEAAARDLPFLRTAGYRLERVRPFDLFPHTPHAEVVFTLVK